VEGVTLPESDTIVLFPDGAVSADAQVLHVEPLPDGRIGVVLDRTPFHPVDPGWPDQGPDRGVLVAGEDEWPVLDVQIGGTQGQELVVGDAMPVRAGTEGWTFVVVHVMPSDTELAEGGMVRAAVDTDLRAALSAGHTACHLAALALDRALAGGWSKPVPADDLGAPAFDRLAVDRSVIRRYGSEDTYRVGKSLRKQGFDPAALDDAEAVAARVEATLHDWVGTGAAVRIEREDQGLSGRRTWVCALPDGEARIPCGGTHLASLADLGPIAVRLVTEPQKGGIALTMTTRVTPEA
jgi:alanyl-tRNA synthetase